MNSLDTEYGSESDIVLMRLLLLAANQRGHGRGLRQSLHCQRKIDLLFSQRHCAVHAEEGQRWKFCLNCFDSRNQAQAWLDMVQCFKGSCDQCD